MPQDADKGKISFHHPLARRRYPFMSGISDIGIINSQIEYLVVKMKEYSYYC
jgi:hypothetical protein